MNIKQWEEVCIACKQSSKSLNKKTCVWLEKLRKGKVNMDSFDFKKLISWSICEQCLKKGETLDKYFKKIKSIVHNDNILCAKCKESNTFYLDINGYICVICKNEIKLW